MTTENSRHSFHQKRSIVSSTYYPPFSESITLTSFNLMLQQNQISNLLKSALLFPASSSTVSSFHPISISLLSNHGNPLISLTTKSQQGNDRQLHLQSQPQLQLQSLHSSKAGTPTSKTIGDEYEQGFNTRTTPSVTTTSANHADSPNDVSSITLDQLKIYSLIAYNSTTETNELAESPESSGGNDWSIVDFGNVKCIISKISLGHNSVSQDDNKRIKQLKDNGQDIKRGSNAINTNDNADDGYNRDDRDDRDDDRGLFDGYFVVLFYQSKPKSKEVHDSSQEDVELEVDAIAKIKIDAIVNALTQGLKGYHEPIAY